MVNQYPFISIIVPVYNVAPYVEACLRSVMAQDYPGKLECILVDDRGTDDSMEVARRVLSGYSGNILFRTTAHSCNKGLSEARNTGLGMAEGDYVYFLDSDDEITAGCMTALAAPVTAHPVDFVVGDVMTVNAKKRMPRLALQEGLVNGTAEIMEGRIRKRWYQMAVNKLYDRTFLETNGLRFKKGILHEDELWSAQLACLARTMFVVKAKTYLYKIREGSITATAARTERRASSLKTIFIEFSQFVLNHDLADPFLANELLQGFLNLATWQEFKHDGKSFHEAYSQVRTGAGIRWNAVAARDGGHFLKQFRDLHYAFGPGFGGIWYRQYCRIHDAFRHLKAARNLGRINK